MHIKPAPLMEKSVKAPHIFFRIWGAPPYNRVGLNLPVRSLVWTCGVLDKILI